MKHNLFFLLGLGFISILLGCQNSNKYSNCKGDVLNGEFCSEIVEKDYFSCVANSNKSRVWRDDNSEQLGIKSIKDRSFSFNIDNFYRESDVIKASGTLILADYKKPLTFKNVSIIVSEWRCNLAVDGKMTNYRITDND